MGSNDERGTLATWANTWSSVLATAVSIAGAIKVATLPELSVLLQAAFIALLSIICVLIWTVFVIRKNSIRLRAPSPKGVANERYYSCLRSSIVATTQRKLHELDRLGLTVEAANLLDIQSTLIDRMISSKTLETNREVCLLATDITDHPEIFSSRSAYFELNKRLLASGCTIRRVFIADGARLQSDCAFRAALANLMEQHKAIGVEVGLQSSLALLPEQMQDFIVFDGSCVLVEGRQADMHYRSGQSYLKFSNADVERFKSIFYSIWTGTAPRSASIIAREFLEGEKSTR